jgi:hypothetical protein
MTVKIVEAKPMHANLVGANLSAVALFDIAHAGVDPTRGILEELSESLVAYAGFYDDELALIWGIKAHSLVVNHGFLWMVTTKVVEEHPFIFARHARIAVDKAMERFSILYGVVNPKAGSSLKWLKYLKFDIHPDTEINGQKYCAFTRRRV